MDYIHLFPNLEFSRRVLIVGPTLTEVFRYSDDETLEPIIPSSNNVKPEIKEDILITDIISSIHSGNRTKYSSETVIDALECINKIPVDDQTNLENIDRPEQIDPKRSDYRFKWVGKITSELRNVGINADMITLCNGQHLSIPEVQHQLGNCVDECVVLTDTNYQRPMTSVFKTPDSIKQISRNIKISECPSSMRKDLLKTLTRMLNTKDYSLLVILDFDHGVFTKEMLKQILILKEEKVFTILTDCHECFGDISENDIDEKTSPYCFPTTERISYKEERAIAVYRKSKRTDVDEATFEEKILTAFAYGLTVGIPFHKLASEIVLTYKHKALNDQIGGPLNPVKLVKVCGRVIFSTEGATQLKHLLKLSCVTIALTTGCFDIFHAGHAAMLEDAKEQADVLVVALNSDTSVQLLKGNTRPICSVKERLCVLLAMNSVDFIVVFNESKPDWIVNVIDPDVFVKGAEYTTDILVKHYPDLKKVYISRHGYDLHTSSIINHSNN